MEESEETVSPARRTRSRKVAKTPVVKSPKAKPATRRTRKKVVLMEVEVSDEDEETPQDVDVSEDDKQQESTDKESPDHTEKESEEKESKQKSKETGDVNGSENNGEGAVPDSTEDAVTVVFNDVEMLEGADDSNSRDQDDDDCNITESKVEKKSDDKMEVETTTSVELVETKKTAIEESLEAQATKDGKKEPQPAVAEHTETSTKIDVSEVAKTKDGIEKESTADEPVKDPVILAKPKVQETKMEVDEELEDKITEQKAEKKTSSEDLAQKQISADTKKSATEADEKAVVKVVEKAVVKVVEKAVVKVDEKAVDKVDEKAVVKVDEEAVVKVDEKAVVKVDEEAVVKVDEKPVVKVEEQAVTNVEEKSVTKVEEKIVKVEEKVVEVEEKAVTKVEEKPVTGVPEKPITKMEEKSITEIEEKPITKTEEKPMCVDEEKMIQEEESKPTSNAGKSENKTDLKVGNEINEQKESIEDQAEKNNKPGDTDAENISEDELPLVQAVKVPEAEEVSDEELPGPKRAELPADTEVVSEDELPTVKTETKKEGTKRKLDATDYDPGSPTSENEAPAKKPSLEAATEKEKDEKPKPKKLPELDKYWKAVNDDPTDFTGWTYLLQYVDQENDMEAAREAYDAFLSHYPYCYGYWRKYADYEKRKGNKKKCEEVFERGLKAIPLSVDLWIHYLTYVKTTRTEDEEFIRSQFERALTACGLEFRSDRLWESYIKWETEGKRLRKVTAIYDRLLATPTQSYTTHFDSFQEHIANNPPNKVIEVDEFLALRKEVRHMLKHDVTTTDTAADNSDAPPGDDDQTKVVSSDEETKSIRERIVSIRRKAHKATVNAVTARWNYEEGIKRPYFHVKPLERCQLKNWQDYLDYETEQGDRVRIIVLFERCLIACALYEEFWLKFVHYLETLKDSELHSKIRDVYERACTIHHLKKPSLHLQWAMFEESVENSNRAAEILVNLEKSVPNILQIAYRRINLERRRSDHEKCAQLYEHYITNSKNKMISSNIAIKFSRFCFKILKDFEKAQEVLKGAITKDPNNPRLYLQLIDLTLQKDNVTDAEIIEIIDSFLDKETTDVDQKVLFSQRKLEYVEDFGADVQSVQAAYEQYQKWLKQSKDSSKKKEAKPEAATSSSKKEKSTTPSSSTTNTYSNYGTYGNSSAQPTYPYSGSQQGQNYYPQYGQGDQQYQYQNWQYPQGGYGGYNQWGGYSGGYGY